MPAGASASHWPNVETEASLPNNSISQTPTTLKTACLSLYHNLASIMYILHLSSC